MNRNRFRTLASIPILLLGLSCSSAPDSSSGSTSARLGEPFGPEAALYLTAENVLDAVTGRRDDPWQPSPNPDRLRGDARVYDDVAPAVVVVRADGSHGTGFLIDEGLVLTNHHVVENAFVDPAGPHSFLEIHVGALDDGRMTLSDSTVRAVVLDVDTTRDLALLRLERRPVELRGTRSVPLADRDPRPGDRAAMIGHPSSGMLWTLRRCEIAAAGSSPRDMVNTLLPILASSESDGRNIRSQLEAIDSRDIVLSSCLANPGDSGGPLVDDRRRLVAVTFAIPGNPAEQKFTYHITRREVATFLDEAAREPRLLLPDPWRLGPNLALLEGGLLFGGVTTKRQALLDLDGDTPPELVAAFDFAELVTGRRFDAEAALHLDERGRYTVFYDTDNDGTMNLILRDRDDDPEADLHYLLGDDGRWVVDDDVSFEILDASVFEDEALGDRFVEMVTALQQG